MSGLRKNYFIKKRFQTNFLFRFVLLLIFETILITSLFIYVARGTLTTGYQGSQLIIEKTASFFLISLLLISLIVGVVIGLSGMLIFIFLSHRIAGPLFRFEKSLEEIAAGNLTHRIRLRRTDQLTELQNSLNRFIERIDTKISEAKQDISGIQQALKETHPDTKTLKESIDRLKVRLDSFKTST